MHSLRSFSVRSDNRISTAIINCEDANPVRNIRTAQQCRIIFHIMLLFPSASIFLSVALFLSRNVLSVAARVAPETPPSWGGGGSLSVTVDYDGAVERKLRRAPTHAPLDPLLVDSTANLRDHAGHDHVMRESGIMSADVEGAGVFSSSSADMPGSEMLAGSDAAAYGSTTSSTKVGSTSYAETGAGSERREAAPDSAGAALLELSSGHRGDRQRRTAHQAVPGGSEAGDIATPRGSSGRALAETVAAHKTVIFFFSVCFFVAWLVIRGAALQSFWTAPPPMWERSVVVAGSSLDPDPFQHQRSAGYYYGVNIVVFCNVLEDLCARTMSRHCSCTVFQHIVSRAEDHNHKNSCCSSGRRAPHTTAGNVSYLPPPTTTGILTYIQIRLIMFSFGIIYLHTDTKIIS